jgi:ABC-2 type transport system ATP-binding protein
MDAIKTNNLTKLYNLGWRQGKLRALDGLNLQVRPGEVFGLLGPNGSGKTTTLKIVLGLMEPTEGDASIFGVPCYKVQSRLHVGFLPENPYFYKYLTGAETLEFFGRLCGLGGKSLDKRIDELIDLVGLSRARDRRLSGYSKGMLQRIGLAQAMIHDPQLLLLDEPTAGVDPIGSRAIRDIILQLKKMGKTVLLSSHLLAQVQDVCDRICVLNLGKMILEGNVGDLIRDQKRTNITVENLSADARRQVEQAIQAGGAQLVAVDHPETTLEDLFLATVRQDKRGMGSHD